jgi:protein O-mannosyl-transferase
MAKKTARKQPKIRTSLCHLADKRNDSTWVRIAFVSTIVALTLVVYWQVSSFAFQSYHDDDDYVTTNQPILDGFTRSSLVWAFTAAHAANWHPLTWISHMLDCQLYGTNASGHHVTSLLFHVANVLLLLLLFKTITGRFWRSAFVASLFALHPLHVESVAWVSERKDVLSTFFMFLTMLAYVRYVREPKAKSYLLSIILYTLGLMAKPMLVTLPLVLLLLDWWPLARRTREGAGPAMSTWQLVREKIPFMLLALASCLVTFIAQKHGGTVRTLEAYSLDIRLSNAFVAYVEYILKMLWPANLAALYPHPVGGWPVWRVAASAVFLGGVTMAAVRSRRPYLVVGWFWYLLTLLPVIGIVQVGEQSYADRYTYISLIGLFLIVAWGMPELVSKILGYSHTKLALTLPAAAILLALTVCSYIQTGYWRDSVTLFEHTIQVVPNNYLAEHELGMGYALENRFADAAPHLRKVIAVKPNWPLAHYNLACVLYLNGEYKDAADEIRVAMRLGFKPADANRAEFARTIERGPPQSSR